MTSAIEPPKPKTAPTRVNWWALLLPFLVIAVLMAGYGIFWTVARSRLNAALNDGANALRAQGYRVAFDGRRIDGFPFRLRMRYAQAAVTAPSGWGLSVPGLEAQAFLHAPFHWVLVAPEGLTLDRPQAGPVAIAGQAIRASIAGEQATPWRVIIEGVKLTFTAGPGVKPFALSKAERIDVGLRPAPDRSGGQLMATLTEGRPSPGGVVGAVFGAGPLNADLALRITRPDRFKGPDWNAAARAWTAAGGQLQVVRLTAASPSILANAAPAALAAGADGRLAGAVPLTLKASARGGDTVWRLAFHDGRAWLGPLALGPAPSLFQP